jgi:hypothetical protein
LTIVSKLLERLGDPAKSGVYRVAHDRDLRNALSADTHDVAALSLGAGKDAMLASIAGALEFPDWFGANWDALEDCLTDLSWRPDKPRVFLFLHAVKGDDLGILLDILTSAAEFWRERGRGFFAVFIDPAGGLGLPALYREKTV